VENMKNTNQAFHFVGTIFHYYYGYYR